MKHSHHQAQAEFWKSAFAHWSSIITKLDECGHTKLADKIRGCHQDESVITCLGCYKSKTITNRCENRFCPLCSGRLARERVEELTIWSKTLKQPKHVVLTARNSQTLTRSRVTAFQRSIARLRRHKEARTWHQGTWSLEVTNEGRGWHLHAHLLIEARWIDSVWLSGAWSKLIGQDFAIVKVKDARADDYLKELLKYVVKSSEIASWCGEDIAQFMTAFKGRRSFGVFGKLSGMRREWKKTVTALRQERSGCECGCREFKIEDARVAELPEHLKRKWRAGR